MYIPRRSPRSQPSLGLSFGPIMCGCPAKLCCGHDLRCVRFLTGTVIAAAVALAGCTSDGTPPSTGDSGTVSSFVRNLFRSNSQDQPPVPHNDVPPVAHNLATLEPSAPKTKSVTSKPKQSAVEVTPPPKQQAIAESQSTPDRAAPPGLSGAAPILPSGGFDNRVGSRR